jgi:signal transduction histidine kinase
MNQQETQIYGKRSSFFRGLSIQQRLPLLICILLLSTVIAVGVAAYIGVKQSSFRISGDRLRMIDSQLSSLFGQSSMSAMLSTKMIANEEPVKNYLLFPGTVPDSIAKISLRKLQTDTQSLYVELLDKNLQRVLRAGRRDIETGIDNRALLTELQLAPDSTRVSKMMQAGDSIYYAIVSTVTADKQIIGYVLRWRLAFTTEEGLRVFSQLLGTDAILYMGNIDGTGWTDLLKPVKAPSVYVNDTTNYYTYTREGIGPVIASARPIPNTEWLMLIEFPQRTILETARRFTGWILIIGGIITVIGILIGWLVSRNMIRPLKQLTAAATSIASGDYDTVVETDRKDELGELARSFMSMSSQIKSAKENLEQKVKDRTSELETVNKELEAFSYSVSHDLRAPLRAINGYAIMLKEDYGDKFDAEAERILTTIMSNAKMMGQLIDDLITFSKTGAKGIHHQKIDMKEMVQSCVDELIGMEPTGKYDICIEDLPPCKGDHNLMKQVWLNLAGNAIKYSSREEKPSIRIGGHEDDTHCHYFIKDNGVGFDMQYAGKLFLVFQRLHTDTLYKGTGIGLALVKRIIDKHNGTIRAESEPGHGATFYFSLPKTTES